MIKPHIYKASIHEVKLFEKGSRFFFEGYYNPTQSKIEKLIGIK